ncbi:MAG: phage/plasmid primase, P4 family [Bdellovibrionota bacterium]
MERERQFSKLKSTATPHEAAREFLYSEGYLKNGLYEIKNYKGQFFIYYGTHYKATTNNNMLLEVIRFLQDQPDLGEKTKTHFAKEVLTNIAAIVMIPDDIEIPCLLGGATNNSSHFISMKNGIFDLDRYLKGKNPLLPHNPNFFSLNSLKFSYSPKATCPKWKKLINEILPDLDVQNAFQEWVGYGLTNDTSFHKFVLMVGAGANGKSIACTVMRALYGKENTSGVGLEQLNPTRTFPLTGMLGKTANIVEEIGDVDKVAEDILKIIVGGGELSVEKKGQDPFLMKFKTKLTFATNVVPRFRDRSDGLWRRIIFLPFIIQTLDPKKQNKNFVDEYWWIKSGEIEGILNWALEGLLSLLNRGHFLEPKASLDMKEEYKAEANPAVTFLLENYMIKVSGNTCSEQLYRQYSDCVKEHGGKPLGKSHFTREVKRVFPQARLSRHPKATKVRDNSNFVRRSRIWENIKVRK